MRLRPVEVSVVVPGLILKAGALLPAATFPPLFSSIVLLFFRLVPTTADFRSMKSCIEHLTYRQRPWLFYTNQPCPWLPDWLLHILCALPPEPHVMVASGWLRPYSSHFVVVRSDRSVVAPMGPQFILMFSGSLFDPDAPGTFFRIPPVIFWPTILPIHKKFQIVE